MRKNLAHIIYWWHELMVSSHSHFFACQRIKFFQLSNILWCGIVIFHSLNERNRPRDKNKILMGIWFEIFFVLAHDFSSHWIGTYIYLTSRKSNEKMWIIQMDSIMLKICQLSDIWLFVFKHKHTYFACSSTIRLSQFCVKNSNHISIAWKNTCVWWPNRITDTHQMNSTLQITRNTTANKRFICL